MEETVNSIRSKVEKINKIFPRNREKGKSLIDELIKEVKDKKVVVEGIPLGEFASFLDKLLHESFFDSKVNFKRSKYYSFGLKLIRENRDYLIKLLKEESNVSTFGWALGRLAYFVKFKKDLRNLVNSKLKYFEKALDKKKISEVGTFLHGIGKCSKKVANEIIEKYKEEILKIDVSNYSLGQAGWFLLGLSYNKKVAKEFIKKNENYLLKWKVKELPDLFHYLKSLYKIDKKFTYKFISENSGKIYNLIKRSKESTLKWAVKILIPEASKLLGEMLIWYRDAFNLKENFIKNLSRYIK